MSKKTVDKTFYFIDDDKVLIYCVFCKRQNVAKNWIEFYRPYRPAPDYNDTLFLTDSEYESLVNVFTPPYDWLGEQLYYVVDSKEIFSEYLSDLKKKIPVESQSTVLQYIHDLFYDEVF